MISTLRHLRKELSPERIVKAAMLTRWQLHRCRALTRGLGGAHVSAL